MAERKSEWCPGRHIKPIIGTCRICKKTVCGDCQSPIQSENNEKIICKFCFEDLQEIEKKVEEGKNRKVKLDSPEQGGLWDSFISLFIKPKEKQCHDNVHIGETVIGMCVACRKAVCEKCNYPEAKLKGGYICRKCYCSLHNVQEEIRNEKIDRIIGTFRGFFGKIARNIRTILLVSGVLTLFAVIMLFVTVTVYYQMHPEDFERFGEDFKTGNYSLMVKRDFPSVLGEMKNRFMFYWKNMYDPHATYEDYVQKQRGGGEDNNKDND